MIGIAGAPVLLREFVATSRRPRTYVFQTVFLAFLVLCLIPLWPGSGKSSSGAEIAEAAGSIFEYGGYLQLLLLALLAPATTANAITEEKDGNTLDLLLLSGAGPYAIVWGKFFSRLFNLVFLLFLTLPLLFALLTLGGVSAASIAIEFAILVCFSVFAAGLGIFLSTVFAKATGVIVVGYVLLAALIALPLLLEQLQVLGAAPGMLSTASAWISPLYDLIYLFHPQRFVATESFPSRWWVLPLWNVGAGLSLVLVAGVLLPYARSIERLLSLRRILEGFDSATYLAMRPRLLLARLRGKAASAAVTTAAPGAVGAPAVVGPARDAIAIGSTNPIYWKETSVNTIGRFKDWWRANLAVLAAMVGCYVLFEPQLKLIEFHKVTVGVLTGLLVLLSTIIAATTVSHEREDGSLVLLATTPVDCPTYINGKVRGIARNIVFLVALPFIHVILFTAVGIIHPASLLFLLMAVPIAVVASVMQGIFVSLLATTTFRAIIGAIVVVIIEAALPAVCCLPTFNLPVTMYYAVEPLQGASMTALPGVSQGSFLTAMALALLFSAGTQLGFTVVVYSLIRSGFDRYIGRAG